MAHSPEEQLELVRAHTVDIIPEDELLEKLRSGRPLRVKYGVDPTGPDLHIGHVVPLRKLRAFQDLGHIAVLIIGDFTGMIGDPSGRNEARPQLTREQVERNAAGYQQQAFKVVDPPKHETCHLMGYPLHDRMPLFVFRYGWEGWPWERETLMGSVSLSDELSPRARDAVGSYWRGIEKRTGESYLNSEFAGTATNE